MTSLADRWLVIGVRFFVALGLAFTLSSGLSACESQTAPKFPPIPEEQDEDPGDEEDDG